MDDAMLLLGRDHATWGEFTLLAADRGHSAAALSVGSDPTSPSMQSKASRMYPNEDALLLADHGELVLLAVADAHRGHESSHALLSGLADSGPEIPATPRELALRLGALSVPATNPQTGTTLLVAVYDRRVGKGFGTSFGDSSLVLVEPGRAEFVNLRRAQYLVPGPPIDPDDGLSFHFDAGPGALLVAFTDGIDECDYRSPATSIGARHLERLFDRTGPDPRRFAEQLVQMALSGVDGHPGGQDNIALVVCATAGDDR